MKVNTLGNKVNRISLRGVKRVPAALGTGMTALVVVNPVGTAGTRLDIPGARPDRFCASYGVGVNFSLRRPDGQMAYAHAEVGLLQGDAFMFLKGAALDLGEVTSNPVTGACESLERPLAYLCQALDAAIAARSELAISANDDGSITVALVYRNAPRELRGPRGVLPRMEGTASGADFQHFFRLRHTKRKKQKA